MSITAKLIAFFNPKTVTPIRPERTSISLSSIKPPRVKPNWVGTLEQPRLNESLVVINKWGAMNHAIAHGDSFEFHDTDVCWCYLYEFNHLIPDFLIQGVNESDRGDFDAGGSTETKAGGHNEDDAGVYDCGIRERNSEITNAALLDLIKANRYDRNDVQHDWDCAIAFNKLFDYNSDILNRYRCLKRLTRNLVEVGQQICTERHLTNDTHDELITTIRGFQNGAWLINRRGGKAKDKNS